MDMLYYHHCRSLEGVVFGEVKSNSKYFDSYLKEAYLWLKKQINFYPMFLAVGLTEEDIYMTGYSNQWRRIIGSKISMRRKDGTYILKNILRKTGEFPNDVLFSFEEVDGVFMDYEHWHLAFNPRTIKAMSGYEKRLIFKPSWDMSKWLKKASKEPHSVQLVTPRLYLPDAKRIWVRNTKTKKLLEKIGFKKVEIKRIETI